MARIRIPYRFKGSGQSRRTAYFPLRGGEDLVTPQYSRKPGTLVGSLNFECDASGRYRRVAGYERFDGQTAPSDESYWYLEYELGTVEVAAGATVTGVTSSATGIAVIASVVNSGSYAGSDAAGYLILRSVSGNFVTGENLQVSAVTVSVSKSRSIKRGASASLDLTYYYAAREAARDDITAVPGSGDVLGVWVYDGNVYAFRNNSAGTAAVMYKNSAAGWSAVDLKSYIQFDGGTVEFTEGDTLTDGGSGATADIMRLVVTSGTWAGNDAAGYLMLDNIVGTFVNNNAITDGAGGAAVADGTTVAVSLNPGGRYEFVNENFYGSSGTRAMYGCDGANYAFEFDGTTFTQIRTGMTTDTPNHIFAHKNHLFLAFTGGLSSIVLRVTLFHGVRLQEQVK